MEVIYRQTPNYTKGRKGFKPIAIVNHITAGSFPGCLNWLLNPEAKTSTHYLITREGKVYQLVKEEDTAWGNGISNKPTWNKIKKGVNPNLYTISIEHEGYGALNTGGTGLLTEKQYQATLQLHKEIIQRWGLKPTKDYIIGHNEINPISRPNCPGKNFPWETLLKDLNEGTQIKSEATKIISNINYKGTTYSVPGFNIPTSEGAQNYFHIREVAKILGLNVRWDSKAQVIHLE